MKRIIPLKPRTESERQAYIDGYKAGERFSVKWIAVNNPQYSPFDGSEEFKYICSKCGVIELHKRHFCPECGSEMQGEVQAHNETS